LPADESICIGPADARASYLNIPSIISGRVHLGEHRGYVSGDIAMSVSAEMDAAEMMLGILR